LAPAPFAVGIDYDGLDNLVKLTYPNNRQVVYEVDPGNDTRIRKVYEPGRTVFADQITYDASGALGSYVAGNGQVEAHHLRLAGEARSAGQRPLHLDYDYEKTGNVKKIADVRARVHAGLRLRRGRRLRHVYGSFGAATFDYERPGQPGAEKTTSPTSIRRRPIASTARPAASRPRRTPTMPSAISRPKRRGCSTTRRSTCSKPIRSPDVVPAP
jgi:hypothetical protein